MSLDWVACHFPTTTFLLSPCIHHPLLLLLLFLLLRRPASPPRRRKWSFVFVFWRLKMALRKWWLALQICEDAAGIESSCAIAPPRGPDRESSTFSLAMSFVLIFCLDIFLNVWFTFYGKSQSTFPSEDFWRFLFCSIVGFSRLRVFHSLHNKSKC